MAGAVLERVLVDEAIEVVRQLAGHFRWATGAGAIPQALDSLVGKAMDPLAQRGIGKVQRVGHRLEAVPLDDFAYGLGTAEDAGLLRLLEEGIQGGERLLGKVEFEGPHSGGLQEKLLQKFTGVHSPWLLLSEHNLFDSNFSGAACTRAVELLDTIPGIDQRGAEVIVAEIGIDMTRFETAPRLA